MRFFSNEAKENTDGQQVAENDQDGVPVPQQRSGSPWSDTPSSGTATDTPESAEAEPADQEDRDDAEDSLRLDDSEVRHDGDDLVPDADATHSDDLDLPLDDRPAEDGDLRTGSHRAEGDDSFVSSGPPVNDSAVDGSVVEDSSEDRVDTAGDQVDETPGAEQRDGTTTTYGPDGSMTTVDDSDDTVAADAEPVVADTADTADRTDEERDLDEAAPAVAVVPVETTEPDDATADDSVADSTVDDSVVDTTVDDSVADSATDDSVADSTVDDSAADSATDDVTDAEAAPAVVAVPVGAAEAATTTAAEPDLTAAPVGDRLFADADSFNDRLRDIALNFVDNPKEATEQAGALVDEAIDQVTSALKAQKDSLAGEGDDTEKLRVELRGYREILKRITSL